MITIQYGPWLPDIANQPFQMPDQQGPVQVPLADCLNVIHTNSNYQSMLNPTTIGSALPAQVMGAFTFKDASGSPVPLAGVLADKAYYYQGGTWSQLLNTGFTDTQRWNFAEFGGQICVQAVTSNVFEYTSWGGTGTGNLYISLGGATQFVPQQVAGAPWARVMAVVGQFVMVGDLAVPVSIRSVIGTGNGSAVTFSGVIFNSSGGSPPPLYPGSIQIVGGAGQIGNDNGQGVITGTGISSGTVNYDTGSVTVTFTAPPPNLTTILGVGAAACRSRLQWGPIGNPGSTWPVPGTNAALATQSGINDLETEYGPIMNISGYPLYGVIFQRTAITRANYIGGNVVWSWQTFSRNIGLLAQYAMVQVGERTYFLADSGFYYTDGANVIPIGTAQDNSAGIDAWFFANLNYSSVQNIRAAYDARLRNVVFSIPTGAHTLPDTQLCYNVLSGRWTRSNITTEMIWTDSDGQTERFAMFLGHAYALLTAAPSTGYLESVDLAFSDGMLRNTNGVRPNGAMTSPVVTVGTRNTMKQSVTYNAGFAPDSFGAGFAPALTEGLYTRIRVTDTNASSIHGATCDMTQAGYL